MLAALPLGLALWLFAAGHILAIDPGLAVNLATWTSDHGNGYVGVQVNGRWAPPEQRGQPVRTEFWSEWQSQGNPSPFCHVFWVIVHRAHECELGGRNCLRRDMQPHKPNRRRSRARATVS